MAAKFGCTPGVRFIQETRGAPPTVGAQRRKLWRNRSDRRGKALHIPVRTPLFFTQKVTVSMIPSE